MTAPVTFPSSLSKILVVGGAGYIGSHMVCCLQEAGYQPIVLDNLSTGHQEAVLNAPLIIGDLADEILLDDLFKRHHFSAIMHFASCIEVAESIQNPLKYYQNNVAATLILLKVMLRYHIKPIIFSSSAAVYGEPTANLINESHPLAPINPYGRSKYMVEEIIKDLAQNQTINYGILRYFNAAGADPQGRLGERHQPESHLIPLILQVAAGQRDRITVNGTDYPTIDGTCVRDYVHVTDLCQAHLRALQVIINEKENVICNLGAGRGYSILQIINAAREVTGQPIEHVIGEARLGDPAMLVADISCARDKLDWQPQYHDIHSIINHAWQFVRANHLVTC